MVQNFQILIFNFTRDRDKTLLQEKALMEAALASHTLIISRRGFGSRIKDFTGI